MPRRPGLRRLLTTPPMRVLLALEAAFELALARVNTLGSAQHFTRFMGELEGRPIGADPKQQEKAKVIGHVVELTSRVMPFRAVCLQQVLATRRMLKRRHVPATVYLGVNPGGVGADAPTLDGLDTDTLLAAHAWVKSGNCVVNGNTRDLDRYVVLGVFS